MTSPLRLLIHGASGRMGQALLRLAAERDDLSVAAAVARKSPAQRVVEGVPQFAASELNGVPEFDVAIDFSLPEGFDPVLALCVQRGCALVSGTTGLSSAQNQAIDAASAGIAVVWAANYSLGVAVLTELVRRAAAALPAWDCDLIEAHHTRKLDAPSGTALHLGQAVAIGRGSEPHYASLRAGDIVGEHLVQFASAGERLELIHRATNRDIFARGALEAALKLARQAPGRYRLAELMFPNL
ncbi:4-hydroxy-tetrahydrodipicolinate reductase [Lysobacter silvisoli]|uniref:4-hydroxy-tetrahydrodipicolinate reductase n=1 Tax=Lysobacter silvisoli TaxID=2293254 RepID=A0A371K456_9GAMM|nr:4-hydroxy-tetrahydrodipicolinate reductase [Lysobacter silvisoli]RDZ28644.1 4-hydroxy-tetrahydrodipicolinate reductase [Lysobacter silvisoli]